jgi:hypothetical protein
MASMYDVLELVRARPSMYVGWDDSQYDRRLAGLEMLIAGYSLAVYHHGLKDSGWEEYASFPSYLQERFGWSMSCGPIVAIRDAAASDREAWDLFWRLLQEFRDSRSQSGW